MYVVTELCLVKRANKVEQESTTLCFVVSIARTTMRSPLQPPPKEEAFDLPFQIHPRLHSLELGMEFLDRCCFFLSKKR